MYNQPENGEIKQLLAELNDHLTSDGRPVAIILAAGHGKRIKSERSKMLHEIWGVPTVVRVAQAARAGLSSDNQIIVVGIKAKEVAESSGRQKNRVFVYQPEQKGTGDAVKVALNMLKGRRNVPDLYIFPGDMGLITPEVVSDFKTKFENSGAGLALLTGLFQGDSRENSYGRIVRADSEPGNRMTINLNDSPVLAIVEHKDILALPEDSPYTVEYNCQQHKFTRETLLNIREYNASVYAFKGDLLKKYIDQLKPDNVQGELYLTDMIGIFNNNGIDVRAWPVDDETAVIGFNVKSVLKEMENIARRKVWRQLRDIIFIEDEDDFFIADEVVRRILELDRTCPPLDIKIGKGVHISAGVELGVGVTLLSGCNLSGNIRIGKNTLIQENVSISTYVHQKLTIGENCVIMRGDLLKGNITIGDNSHIESSVIITGSDEYPTVIGKNVIIKGTTYIFGSRIEDDLFIEHSVLKCKYVERTVRKNGTIQPVRWVMPPPQGLDIVQDL